MDDLIRAIDDYPNGTRLIVEWLNGYTVLGEIDTIYDSDDGEEPGDDNYQVTYICVFHVLEILNRSIEKEYFGKGDLIEISMKNPPSRVFTIDGKVIWIGYTKLYRKDEVMVYS